MRPLQEIEASPLAIIGVAVLCASLVVGCGASDNVAPEFRQAPLEELFPLQSRVEYSVPGSEDHPIGLVTSAEIDPSGSIVLADYSMREVKVIREGGGLETILGSVGQGPGEYMQPISVDLSPSGSNLLVADASQGRVVGYDVSKRTHSGSMVNLDSPVTVHGVHYISDSTFAVSGNPRDYAYADDPKGLALYSLRDSTWTRALPFPERLQNKALGSNMITSLVGVAGDDIYAVLDGHSVLYKLSRDGTKRDSLMLPSGLYPGVDFPRQSEWNGGIQEMKEFARAHKWYHSIVPLAEQGTVALGIDGQDDERSEWLQTVAIADFDEHRVYATRQPCRCKLLEARDGELLLMRGSAGTGFEFEWRRAVAAESP